MTPEQVKRLIGERLPQTEKLPGRESEMDYNDAGGTGFIDNAKRLERFVILGVDDGTLYVDKNTLTKRTIELVQALPYETVRDVTLDNLDKAWRRRNPLAVAAIRAALVKEDRAKVASEMLPALVNTPSDLLYFARLYHQELAAPFSRSVRRAVSDKLNGFSEFHLAKYRKRWGFGLDDLIKLTHPKPRDERRSVAFRYLLSSGGEYAVPGSYFYHLETLKRVESLDEMIKIITMHGLSWEFAPTWALKEPKFWEALFKEGWIPEMALVRNAWRFANPAISPETRGKVVEALANVERVHPGYILTAWIELKNRQEKLGSLASPLIDALWRAFESRSGASQRRDRIAIGLDVSGSTFVKAGNALLIERILAMGAILKRVFPNSDLVYFDSRVKPGPNDPVAALEYVDNYYYSYDEKGWGGGTALAAPVAHFAKLAPPYDAVVIITDEEGWQGEHIQQVYKRNKKKLGKLIVVTVSGAATVSMTDPKDPDQLTVVGIVPDLDEIVGRFLES